MARNRTQGYHRAFDKSWRMRQEEEQQRKERREEKERATQGLATTYVLYVGGKEQLRCSDWYIAHTTYVGCYGIEEWTGRPIHVTINGTPTWGTTPDALADPQTARRLKANRTRYLRKAGESTDEEREEQATAKFADLVAKTQKELASFLPTKRTQE